MKTVLFIILVLLSGILAGLVYGVTNLILVEPILDDAIELQRLDSDDLQPLAEYNEYRDWQKSGQVLAGAILGISIGSLFGIVYVYAKDVLPGNNQIIKTLILGVVMWFVIELIPFLKYPTNPPTVGVEDTLPLRVLLYVVFVVISGLSAIGFYHVSKKLYKSKKIFALIGYFIFMFCIAIVMPDNPDTISTSMDLVNQFRIMSMISISVFWISLGLIFGALWIKFNPESV